MSEMQQLALDLCDVTRYVSLEGVIYGTGSAAYTGARTEIVVARPGTCASDVSAVVFTLVERDYAHWLRQPEMGDRVLVRYEPLGWRRGRLVNLHLIKPGCVPYKLGTDADRK